MYHLLANVLRMNEEVDKEQQQQEGKDTAFFNQLTYITECAMIIFNHIPAYGE